MTVFMFLRTRLEMFLHHAPGSERCDDATPAGTTKGGRREGRDTREHTDARTRDDTELAEPNTHCTSGPIASVHEPRHGVHSAPSTTSVDRF